MPSQDLDILIEQDDADRANAIRIEAVKRALERLNAAPVDDPAAAAPQVAPQGLNPTNRALIEEFFRKGSLR